MITIKGAKKLLVEHTPRLDPEHVDLQHASGFVTAEDIHSPVDLPLFSNSAVDGYAVRSSDLMKTPSRLTLTHESKAGDSRKLRLGKGEAARVFTGAPIPEGADCVVMQEYTRSEGGSVVIARAVARDENVRRRGEEMQKGAMVLPRGAKLGPASVALLANIGLAKVRVVGKPGVYLTVTGNEIVRPGVELGPGQVYDSNSFAIRSALVGAGIDDIGMTRAGDSLAALTRAFERGASRSDVLIFTGGISVGKYDLLGELFERSGVRTVFYRVLQRPGKPLFFGKLGDKLVFGLPGNPVSSLVCFYEYVYPALRIMMGHELPFMREETLVLGSGIEDVRGKVSFLRGRETARGTVSPLKHQHSHMLSSLAAADCLIVVPQNTVSIAKGERVRVHMLPNPV